MITSSHDHTLSPSTSSTNGGSRRDASRASNNSLFVVWALDALSLTTLTLGQRKWRWLQAATTTHHLQHHRRMEARGTTRLEPQATVYCCLGPRCSLTYYPNPWATRMTMITSSHDHTVSFNIIDERRRDASRASNDSLFVVWALDAPSLTTLTLGLRVIDMIIGKSSLKLSTRGNQRPTPCEIFWKVNKPYRKQALRENDSRQILHGN